MLDQLPTAIIKYCILRNLLWNDTMSLQSFALVNKNSYNKSKKQLQVNHLLIEWIAKIRDKYGYHIYNNNMPIGGFVIDKPGKYVLCEDIYIPKGVSCAAITIASSNVTFDGKGYCIIGHSDTPNEPYNVTDDIVDIPNKKKLRTIKKTKQKKTHNRIIKCKLREKRPKMSYY